MLNPSLSCFTWLMAASSATALMEFQSRTMEQLVANLMADNGDVQYRNIKASPILSGCASYFSNGHSLGNLLNITDQSHVTNLTGPDGLPIPIVPDKGVMLSSGSPASFNLQGNYVNDPNADKITSTFSVSSTDDDLQQYVAARVFDACWIEFEFRCTDNSYVPSVSFSYVFGSEEYYEYVNSQFNDVFAFFLNGVNIATLPTTESDSSIVSINNVNYGKNTKYFHGNDPGLNNIGTGNGLDPTGVQTKVWYPNIEADGFTSKLIAQGSPKPISEWNKIKLAVADVGDNILDSWVVLESGTFTCVRITSDPTRAPTKNPTKKPTPSPSKKPTAAPSKIPTAFPSKEPTASPSKKPTASPSKKPTDSPSKKPTASPTQKPTVSPTTKPTASPTRKPTSSPSEKPTFSPTKKPTSSPTKKPTSSPSEMPTFSPTTKPTATPSKKPTSSPSNKPTFSPTTKPTASPTTKPTASPTKKPTSSPSNKPTFSPTTNPTDSPTQKPTSSPSKKPTVSPTTKPTASPSKKPTVSPSNKPTSSPSEKPTSSPTTKPTASPSKRPTASPTQSPTVSPTTKPTASPSKKPTFSPSKKPTSSPSEKPTFSPTTKPTDRPTVSPSSSPTMTPSSSPTKNPTRSPTDYPSVSTMPNSSPSTSPSISSAPSKSHHPSVSSAPSISSQPTVSSLPSRSSHPSVSSHPSMSSEPSISSQPSVSSSPSQSSQPSISPKPSVSSAPSISSQPSVSISPSISSKPSVHGSLTPSVSSAPSHSPASIGPNVIFEDSNGNGFREQTEPVLSGIVVILYNDEKKQVGETTTDSDGKYEFVDLPAGTYHIQVKFDQSSYTLSPVKEGGNQANPDGTTDPETLDLGENIDTWDVGMFKSVSVGNTVFDDLNGNAIKDVGEPGVQGVTIILVNGAGDEVATQVTKVDGSYLFEAMPPGKYSVQFEIPDSYVFIPFSNLNLDLINSGSPGIETSDYTSDVNAETGVTPVHDLMSGDVDLTFDAGIYVPAVIRGVTWHDLNANGVQEEVEPGLEGATIVLYNDDEEVVATAISGPGGTYTFSDLIPDGYYSVIMPPSPEYQLSPSGSGSKSVFDPNSFKSYPVTLQSGGSGEGANAGMFKLATVSDRVWNDSIYNGIQDSAETAHDGPVTVNLYNSEGNKIQTSQVDVSGSYSFSDVVPGNYEIEFIVGVGKYFTIQNAGSDDNKDSDVNPSTGKVSLTLMSGESNSNIAAGVTIRASVGPNRVFEDANGNGSQDEGELGQPGVVIDLVDNEGIKVATTKSDENGNYKLVDIPSGNYHIEVKLEDGFTMFSPVVPGGNQVSQVDDLPYGSSPVVKLEHGSEEKTWDVGMIKAASIGNKVWNDLNGDGIQDTTEPGMPNITAILVDDSGKELDRAVTDVNGKYIFDGLQPGRYAVKFDIPDEYLFTPKAKPAAVITSSVDGSNKYEDVTSDVNVITGMTGTVELKSGETNLSFDAGIFIPVSISGTTWHDLNANGVHEENEPGLPGSTVYLYDRDGDLVGQPVYTGSDGKYLIEDLPPGKYHTTLSPPSPEYVLSSNGGDSDSDFIPDSAPFQTAPVTLNSGESGEGQFDAGLYLPAKIGDRVWYDEQPNGIQDGDEIAFDGPVTITLYDSLGFVVQSTTPEAGSGSYQFDNLKPGTYELIAVVDKEGYVLTIQNNSNDTGIDSDVNPSTGKTSVTVTSGEENNSIDIGIMDDAPYYPDWTNDLQICTNDGFDPKWLELQKVNYLYKNKEACCKQHFWWRITQCMQNEEFKFYKNGEICDSKIHFEDWESNSPAAWTDTTIFDTLDECCANKFWYDFDGCIARSPVMFKFEFCVNVKGLVEPQDCQSADIFANVLESAVNAGVDLDGDSEQKARNDANITTIGNVTLTKVDGSTICGGSLEGQAFINDKTGIVPDIAAAANTVTTLCGVITVEDENCTQADCLTDHYKNLTSTLKQYVNDGTFTSNLNSKAVTRLPPVPELLKVTGLNGTFTSSNLLLPATITGDGSYKYHHGSNLKTCMKKTVFLATETPYDSLYDCCRVSFHYDINTCCKEGGGCPEVSIVGSDSAEPEYYPTWEEGRLCASKTNFESWETHYATLAKCCDAHFGSSKTACMNPSTV